MSTFDNPFDPQRPLVPGCPCGRHLNQLDHERDAATQLQCAPVESEEKRYESVVASAVMRSVFPKDAARRAFLKSVGASTALAALSQFFTRFLRQEQRSYWEMDDLTAIAEPVYANRFALDTSPNQRSVSFGDGLELRGSTLFVVRNQLEEVDVVRLRDDASRGRVVDTLTDPSLDVPTTTAFVAGRLWTVNARFGTDPTPTTPYALTRLTP